MQIFSYPNNQVASWRANEKNKHWEQSAGQKKLSFDL